MKGYTVKVTLERTIYIDDNGKIESEIISPLDALRTADNFLKSKGIKINKLDLKDWSLSNIKYEELNENSKQI